MKYKAYILEKDYQFIDAIQKRMLLENDIGIAGVQADASSAYQEMLNQKPDFLIFGYPMNFKAEQLVQAMKVVKQDMVMIALLDPGMEGFTNELQSAGIRNVFIKPLNIEDIMDVMKKTIKERVNPYVQANPFGGAPQTGNPFASAPVSANPFAAQAPSPNAFESSGNTPPQYNPFGGSSAPVPNGSYNTPSPFPAYSGNTGAIQGGHGFQMNYGASEPEFGGSNQTFKTLRQNIVAIHCPKGGVGKTSISVNTATALSTVMIGKQPLKVLLVDMDWEFGDVCVNMGLKPNTNVMKWINEIKARRAQNPNADMNFTGAQIDKFMIKYKTGLHILAAPPNHNDVVDIPGDAAKIIIDNLKNNCAYDVIIFDCGNNTESYTLQALLSAHSVYEVITMDVAAMNDLSMLLNTLKSISFPMDKIKIIMNRVPKTKGDGDFSLDEISEALGGLPIAAKVPEYEKVRIQNNRGEPLILSKQPNPFTDAIKMTANEIVGNKIFTTKKGGGRPASKNSGSGEKKGFFSRLFG